MKYVMFCRKLKGGDLLQFEPVIFGKNQVHLLIAHAFCRIKGNEDFVAVSAGEVAIDLSGRWMCFGRSETLKLEANSRDAAIIQGHDYGSGLFG